MRPDQGVNAKQFSHAIRGAALTFSGDPFLIGASAAMHYEPDALVVMADGVITAFGAYADIKKTLQPDIAITSYTDSLILPGFID